MIKLDENLLVELGLSTLPKDEKTAFLKHMYETLEMRVGTRLAEKMSDAQMSEFEQFINGNDEQGAFHWLEGNFPNYKDVVAEEFEKLKGEIKPLAPQIVAASQAQAGQQHQPELESQAAQPPAPQPQPSAPTPEPQAYQPHPQAQPEPQAEPRPYQPHVPQQPPQQYAPQPSQPQSGSYGPPPATPPQAQLPHQPQPSQYQQPQYNPQPQQPPQTHQQPGQQPYPPNQGYQQPPQQQ